jgi:ATP-dependent Lon protease
VHIHVPAGAIPKDGPSAGITMATALVSAVSGRKVRRDVAMTGELTLTGRVLPIGGVKEKVLGAVRAGIKEIIVPIDNEADLEDIPDEVRAGMKFHLAETLDDVMRVALKDEKGASAKAPSVSRIASTSDGEKPNGEQPSAKKKAPAARKPVAKKKPTKQ